MPPEGLRSRRYARQSSVEGDIAGGEVDGSRLQPDHDPPTPPTTTTQPMTVAYASAGQITRSAAIFRLFPSVSFTAANLG